MKLTLGVDHVRQAIQDYVKKMFKDEIHVTSISASQNGPGYEVELEVKEEVVGGLTRESEMTSENTPQSPTRTPRTARSVLPGHL